MPYVNLLSWHSPQIAEYYQGTPASHEVFAAV